ncbi:MAG: hypothetical protein DRP62_03455 [Planctomycetota bacterium]|nr:MAG: hypothetical protein DRP62_03455 [Planctomycetota bacterium]
MNVLGIRCSNRDYTFAILSGTKKRPRLIDCNTILFPKGFAKPKSVKWMLQEIDTLLKQHRIKKIAMKKNESQFRGKPYDERIECETMVYLAAENCGIKVVCKKTKGTIAKDLGLKGRAHYLATSLNTSLISDYDSYSDKQQEAILAAWSELT